MGGGASSAIYAIAEDSDNNRVSDIVDAFVIDRVKHVANNTSRPETMAKNSNNSSSVIHRLKPQDGIKSLSSFAFRQHLKQSNSYIPTEVISASFLSKRSSFGNAGMKAASSGSLDEAHSVNGHGSGNSVGAQSNTHAIHSGSKKVKRSHSKIQDDADWIPVSDEEDENTLAEGAHGAAGTGGGSALSSASSMGHMVHGPPVAGHRPPPLTSGLVNSAPLPPAQSYLFTQSGTMLVNGFMAMIGKTGLQTIADESELLPTDTTAAIPTVAVSHKGLQLPMRERLVVLCKLGQGASSIVYKVPVPVSRSVPALMVLPRHWI